MDGARGCPPFAPAGFRGRYDVFRPGAVPGRSEAALALASRSWRRPDVWWRLRGRAARRPQVTGIHSAIGPRYPEGMSDTDPVSSEPRCFSIRLPRPLWIGLAAIVLVVVAVGLRIGTPIYRQQVAIREIERLNGRVDLRRQAPKWLRDILGDDWAKPFDEVIVVNLRGMRATDATLGLVSRLTGVESLWLDHTQVTDAGLIHLKEMRSLEKLYLANTRVTDAGLAHLNGLSGLQVLSLDATQVSGSGLADLKELSRLEQLWLGNTPMTDTGLVHLKELTSLQKLELKDTKVTDAGLAHLRGLTKLGWLDLTRTQATDAGVADLQRALPGLTIER